MAYPTYTISTDTLDGTFDSSLLHTQITASVSITTPLASVCQEDGLFTLFFSGTPSGAEQTACDALVAAHTATVIPTPTVSSNMGLLIPFGAKFNDTGKLAIANGRSSDGDESSRSKTRQPIPVTGELTKLVYQTDNANSSTIIKIRVNGVVQGTVTLSSINANDGGVETLSTSVVAGDYVEIEYDAGTAPNESTWFLLLEAA